jgi:lysyl-tRNA synthetase, class II
MDQLHLSEQELIRRQALDELIKLGINPFPAETFELNTTSKEILKIFSQAAISSGK